MTARGSVQCLNIVPSGTLVRIHQPARHKHKPPPDVQLIRTNSLSIFEPVEGGEDPGDGCCMQAFIDAAAAAEVQTELAARVGEWQEKVSVVLQDQDARPPFDLQAYGTSLLDRLSDLSLRHAPDPLCIPQFKLHQAPGLPMSLCCIIFCRAKGSPFFTSIRQLACNFTTMHCLLDVGQWFWSSMGRA